MHGTFSEISEIQPPRFEMSSLGQMSESFDIASFAPEEADKPLGKIVESFEASCKTDDNGETYSENGHLLPNTTYELNGNVYTTDENGRIVHVEAVPESSPENPRDNSAQQRCGGEDRLPTDHGGHVVARDLGGDSGEGNLVAMDSRINQSDYTLMENDVKAALDEGKEVTTKTDISYDGDSERPDKITVTVTIDGKDTVYKFDNNMDGSLMDEVPENGREAVQRRLDKDGGTVSSIKEEYDENGNLVKTTVTITTKDEDGNNIRFRIPIPARGE